MPANSKLPPIVGSVVPRQEPEKEETFSRLTTKASSTLIPCGSTIRPVIFGLGVSAIDSSIDSVPTAGSIRWMAWA